MRSKSQALITFSGALILSFASVAHANETVKSPFEKHPKKHAPKCIEKKACTVIPACSLFKSGFHAGLQVGYSHMHGKYTNDYFDTLDTTTLNKSFSKPGIVGEFLLGGRYVWSNNIITGFEVSTLIDSNRLKHKFSHPTGIPPISPFRSELKRTYAIVPSVVLGYHFAQKWHAFLKLGISFSKFKIREDNLLEATSFTHTKKKAAFMPGLGLEYAINSRLSCQGTVTYEQYPKIIKKFQPIVKDPALSDAFYTVRVKKPQYFTLKFGLLIKT